MRTKRFDEIMKILKEKGNVTVGFLNNKLGVSEMTIRRDLNELAKEGLIVRVHGGAVLPDYIGTSYEPVYESKKRMHRDEKIRIGRFAANLVNDMETIVLDSGTTTLYIAKNIKSKLGLKVIVMDIKLAEELANSPNIEAIVIGGKVRTELYSITGHYAEQMLSEFNVDKAFLAADAVDLETGVTNSTIYEVPLKRALTRIAKEVILVADSSKFGRKAFTKVCDLRECSQIVTDKSLNKSILESLKDMKIPINLV